MFNKMLVCLDGSPLAESVLPYVTDEAAFHGTQIVLFTAVSGPTIFSPGIPGVPPMPVETEGLRKQARKTETEALAYLDKLAASFKKKKLRIETATAFGEAGKAIVSYADNNGVDLIALATHGRGGLGRAVFGSVADFVLHETKLPVLIIKPQ